MALRPRVFPGLRLLAVAGQGSRIALRDQGGKLRRGLRSNGATTRIRIKRSAARELRRIQPDIRRRLVEAIDRLAEEPLAGSALKGEFSGLRRLRVGQYRILYEAIRGELTVLVLRVGHRQPAYP